MAMRMILEFRCGYSNRCNCKGFLTASGVVINRRYDLEEIIVYLYCIIQL